MRVRILDLESEEDTYMFDSVVWCYQADDGLLWTMGLA